MSVARWFQSDQRGVHYCPISFVVWRPASSSLVLLRSIVQERGLFPQSHDHVPQPCLRGCHLAGCGLAEDVPGKADRRTLQGREGMP